MIKGFRDFIMRGNVIDLAVGVVVGVAFNGLVMQFTTAFINPLIKLISGGEPLSGQWKVDGQYFRWADFINAVVNFVLIAAVLYFLVVLPLNKFAERRKRNGQPTAPAGPSEDTVLLTQIRDALVAMESRAVAPAQRTPGVPGEATTESR